MYKRIFFFITVIIGAVAVVFLRFFTVEEVQCTTPLGSCGDKYDKVLEEAVGRNLFSAKDYLLRGLNEMSLVEEHEIRYKFPRGYFVQIIEKKPEVALLSGEVYLLYSRKGEFLGEDVDTSLPVVVISQNVGDEGLGHTARLGAEIYSLYGNARIEVRNQGIYTQMEDGLVLIFPFEGDIDVLLGSAGLVLSRLSSHGGAIKINGEVVVPREVDFRSKNPVIRIING